MSLEWRIGWRAYTANGQGSHLAQMVLADPWMADARTPTFSTHLCGPGILSPTDCTVNPSHAYSEVMLKSKLRILSKCFHLN